MIEINLIPNVKLELIKAQKTRSKVIATSIFVSIATLSIVAVLLAYIFGVQSIRGVLADNEIKSGSAKLAKVEDLDKVLTIQNQLTKISELNDSKKIDSRIFDILQVIIPRESAGSSTPLIQISTISIDPESSVITIDGQTGQGYSAVEIFKKTIDGARIKYDDSDTKNPLNFATDISTANTSYGEDSSGKKVLRFTMSFKYAEEIFAYSSKNASIYVVLNGNVTDSYLGLPKSIFTERATDLTEGN